MRCRWDPEYPAYSTGRRWTVGRSDAHLRVSDAERNEVAERLGRHYTDGRLDDAEYRARLDRAMGATTRGDLDGLFDDLPWLPDEQPREPRRRRIVPLLLLVLVVALLAGASLPFVHIPWLLLVVVGLVLWHRAGRRSWRT